MKTAALQPSATTARPKSSQPFFSKDSQATSFWGNKTQEPTFFNGSVIQPKLTIGQPGDQYEQEADAMADQVVQRLSNPEAIQTKPITAPAITPLVQAKCATCEQDEKLQKEEEPEREEDSIQMKPIFESNTPTPEEEIQRKCAACEVEEMVQQKGEIGSYETASASIESSLTSTEGSGSPLPAGTRQQMESSFGADFSRVRVHNDSTAETINTQLQAKAFTRKSDIYFNSGNYNLDDQEGKHLLAHELTHTIQQGASPAFSMGGPPTKNIQKAENKKIIQRSVVDDVFNHFQTGNSFIDFLLGIAAGIIEFIGDLIMGLVALAAGLLGLLAEADRGNILASMGVLGLIVLVILAVAFPEVSIPVLIIIGVGMGLISLVSHLIMLFNPLLTPYQKGKHLGKAIIEALLLAVAIAEIIQFGRVFRAITALTEGVGAGQKIRWFIQLRRFGNIEASLAILDEVKDIEKTIKLLELVNDAERALELVRLERNIDLLLDILRIEGVAFEDVLRFLGKPGMTGSILKGFLRNADGSPRLLVADIDRLLNNSKIADNVIQLESLVNHVKIRNLAQIEELLNNAKVVSGAELQGLLDSAKITSSTQLAELLNSTKVVNAAELQVLLNNTKLTSGAQLSAILNDAKIADAAQLQRLLNSPKIPDATRLQQLLIADITDDAAQIERFLNLVNTADDLERYVRMAGGRGEIARLENLLNLAVAKGDVTRVEGILNAALGNSAIFQKLAGAVPHINVPPIARPPCILPTPIPPYNSLTHNATNGHFLEHTFEFVDLATRKDVIAGTTFWPPGTTPATIEARVQEAVNVLTSAVPPRIISSGNPQTVVLPSGFTVQVGTQGPVTNLRIGQFFPLPTGGGIHFTQVEIGGLWRLLF